MGAAELRASRRTSATTWVAIVATIAVVVGAAYGVRVISGHISRDSGVFVYTGMIIAQGGFPYVDSWDHKGPLTYVLNAWAWMFGQGVAGVAILEGVLLAGSLMATAVLWRRVLPAWVVVVSLWVIGVSYLIVYEGGNFTESWLFPLQLVAYSLAATALLQFGLRPPRVGVVLTGVALGATLAVAVLTRVNNGFGVAVLLALLLVGLRQHRWAFLTSAVVAAAAIVAPTVVWLWQGDAVRAGVEQYIGYSMFYSGADGGWERILSFGQLARTLLFTPAGVATLVALVAGAVLAIEDRTESARSDGRVRRHGLATAVFVVVLLADGGAQLLSGKSYGHYALGALAALVVVGMVAAQGVLAAPWATKLEARAIGLTGGIALVALASVVGVALLSGMALAVDRVGASVRDGVFVESSYQHELVQYVLDHTSADDTVLVHGAETWILAASERRSPTVLTYYMPALQGYGGFAQQYLDQIKAAPPTYIIETPIVEPDAVCGISRECPVGGENLAELAEFVRENYEVETAISGFVFWRRIG